MTPQEAHTVMQQAIDDAYQGLPPLTQQAIDSIDITKQLQEVAGSLKLHFDKWNDLEQEIMLTLLGLEQSDDLLERIEKVTKDRAVALTILTEAVTRIFNPIRDALQGNIAAEEVADVDTTGRATTDASRVELRGDAPSAPVDTVATPFIPVGATPFPSQQQAQQEEVPRVASPDTTAVVDAAAVFKDAKQTPPPPTTPQTQTPQQQLKPLQKKRPRDTGIPQGQLSTERKDVLGDPYREPVE